MLKRPKALMGYRIRETVVALFMLFLLAPLDAERSNATQTLAQLRKALDHLQELDPRNPKTALSSLSKADRDMVTRALLKEIGSDGRSKQNESIAEIADLRFAKIDLNGDGKPEFVVQGTGDDFCSPTGNCAFWVFTRSGGTLKSILYRGAIQTFAVESTRSDGFHDLVLGMHGSATEQELFVYGFKGGRYQRIGCYNASWTRLVNDEVQDLKEPDILPCKK